ncbi:MAG: tetratricopeptide repeat protein [Kofleriaceae bacterium]
MRSPWMALCLVAMIAACGGPQIKEPTAELAKYLPATLEAARPREGDPRTLKVRIWADAGVRAAAAWKDEIADQIDYANQVLTPMAGVRLTIESVKDWARTGEPHDALRALAEADKGSEVAVVIGYVSAADTATKAMAELGDAHPLGHHVIVRGWAETQEAELLARSLPDLKDAERTEVLAAHRRHKQTVALLHMLATSFGAIAETDATLIQHPTYSPKQATFSDRNRELITMAIDDRLAENPQQETAKKLLDSIENASWGGWVTADREQVVRALRGTIDAAKAGQPAADIPAAAFDQISRIKQLAKQGSIADALAELDNVLTAYPGNAGMHQLKCQLLIGKPGVKDPATRAACKRAGELAPGDPAPHIIVGEALARAGDLVAARAELVQAEAKIGNLPIGAADAWRQVIGVYLGMGALTWTEGALAKGNLEGDPAAGVVAQTRARYGIPRSTKLVAPEHEAALVAAIKTALEQVYASKYAEAERTLKAAERKWPGAPGLAAARCDLALRMGNTGGARAACQRALAGDPNESWALYLSGVIALREASTTKAGIESLKKAISVDPELGQAWRTLAKAYHRANDKAALEQLAADYQAKFGQALPP